MTYAKLKDNGEVVCMLINGDIGDQPGQVNGQIFADELHTLDSMGVSKVNIYINSQGGSVSDGMSIFDAIRKVNMTVACYCTGMCHSIAAIIWLAGDERYMADYGSLMFHNPYNSDGSIDKGLDIIRKCLLIMVSQRSDFYDVEQIMNLETWIMAEDAKSMGLSDDTILTENKIKLSINETTDMLNKWRLSSLYQNKFIEKNNNTMKVIKNESVINPAKPNMLDESVINPAKPNMLDSSEEAEEIKEEIEEAKEELSELQEELSEVSGEEEDNEIEDCSKMEGEDEFMDEVIPAEAELIRNAYEKQIKDLSDELKSIKDAQLAEKEKLNLVDEEVQNKKATEMVNMFLKQGRINDKSKDLYLNLAKKDLEGTKAILMDIEIVKKANVILTPSENAKVDLNRNYINEIKNKAKDKRIEKENFYKNRKSVK